MSSDHGHAEVGSGAMTRRHTGLVLILGGLMAVGPLAIDMYLPSLPTLERELGASAGLAQFTLATYFIGMAIGQAFYGPLADRFGRKPPLYAGMALFVLGSLACALAPTVASLVAGRFVQAVGGSAGMVISLAMMRDLFSPKASARVFSRLMLVMGIAPILGPLVGGYVLTVAGWRAIFWGLAGFGLACLASIALRLPETRPVGSRTPAGVGAALRTYLRITCDPSFLGYAVSGSLAMAGMFAYISGSPHLLIDFYGVPAHAYGWIFGVNALGLIVASQVNHRLLARFSSDMVLSRALMVTAFSGMALFLFANTNAGGLAGILVPLFLYVASLGFVNPNASAGAMADQAERAGSASALFGTLRFGMATVSGALVGALHTASALPMAGVIAACGVGALVLHRRLVAGPHGRGLFAWSGTFFGGSRRRNLYNPLREETMKIALFGATGTIGRRIAQEALTRGHAVTAVVRDPARLDISHERLAATKGDVLDPASVAAAVKDHDAVISAYGPGGAAAPETLVDAARSLTEGLGRAGVRRLVVVGGAGGLEVAPGVQLVDTPEFPAPWRPVALAHREALAVYRAADLDWTSVSPAAMITLGARTGRFRIGTDRLIMDDKGESRISAEDYAAALLDEVERPKFIRGCMTVAY